MRPTPAHTLNRSQSAPELTPKRQPSMPEVVIQKIDVDEFEVTSTSSEGKKHTYLFKGAMNSNGEIIAGEWILPKKAPDFVWTKE